MERIETIHYHNQDIICMDASGFSTTIEIEPLLNETHKIVQEMGEGNARLLSNVEDTRYSKEISELAKEFVRRNTPYMKASAIVGVKGIQQILFQTLLKISGRDIKLFEEESEALDWLAKV